MVVPVSHDRTTVLEALQCHAGTARSMNEIWTDYRKELEFTIHKEKTKDHEVAAPDLLSQEARLRKRLGKLNMDMNTCQGDGNCLVSSPDTHS